MLLPLVRRLACVETCQLRLDGLRNFEASSSLVHAWNEFFFRLFAASLASRRAKCDVMASYTSWPFLCAKALKITTSSGGFRAWFIRSNAKKWLANLFTPVLSFFQLLITASIVRSPAVDSSRATFISSR